MCLTGVLILAASMFLVVDVAGAREPFRIDFNDGSLIRGFGWWDDDRLLLYAVNPNGAIVWLHNIGTGERRKLVSARELARIFGVNARWEEMQLTMSPHRRFLSFYAPPSDPLAAALFQVIDVGKGRAVPVSFTKMPVDFIPGVHAWDNADKYVYVAAREYVGPENEISLGRLSLETGAFLGLARKSTVDLIQSLNYDSANHSLILVSRSYLSDYPREEFLLSYDLSMNEFRQLFRAYLFRGIQVSERGQILAATLNPQRAEEDLFPGFLMVNPQGLLPRSPSEGAAERLYSQLVLLDQSSYADDGGSQGQPDVLLTDQRRGFDFNPYLSPDGKYLAFLRLFYRLPHAVVVGLPSNQTFLFLRERESAQEFMVMQGADGYEVSPGGSYLAARSSDHSYIELYELPD